MHVRYDSTLKRGFMKAQTCVGATEPISAHQDFTRLGHGVRQLYISSPHHRNRKPGVFLSCSKVKGPSTNQRAEQTVKA